jgi:hypothetical protein
VCGYSIDNARAGCHRITWAYTRAHVVSIVDAFSTVSNVLRGQAFDLGAVSGEVNHRNSARGRE